MLKKGARLENIKLLGCCSLNNFLKKPPLRNYVLDYI